MSKWKTVRLGDVFELQMGKTPDRKRLDYFKGSHKWISIADISKSEKYISETKECLTDDAISSSGIKIIPKDTVIMSFKLTIGKTAITSNEMYSNEAIMAFLPNKKYETDNSFLYHLFSNKNWSEGSNKAVKGITLNKASLSEMTILLPPLETQKQIAAVLDKCTSLISKYKKMLEKYDTLIKSRFIEMFDKIINESTKIPLEDICDFVTVGIANSATHAFCDNGVIMFRNQNIKEDFLDDSDIIHIKKEFANKYKTKALKENDLLIVRTGYPGICCLVPQKYEGCQTFTTLIARLKKNENINPKFICHYINSDYGREYVNKNQAGVAQQNFGATALSKMPMCIPSIELQNNFATFVQQIDKSKFAVQKSLEKAETLYKSLMQEYFG